MSYRVLCFLFIFFLFGFGLFSLGMDDPDSDQFTTLMDPAPDLVDVETSLCCGPGAPPGCRVPGPKGPLTSSLHRRAQVR